MSNERFDLRAEVPSWQDLGAVHLVAIGGAGMSAVARLLLARGLTVSGSDAADSPVLHALREAGARVHVGHDAAHLAGADTVVVSSAVREDNPELAAARASGRISVIWADAATGRKTAVHSVSRTLFFECLFMCKPLGPLPPATANPGEATRSACEMQSPGPDT